MKDPLIKNCPVYLSHLQSLTMYIQDQPGIVWPQNTAAEGCLESSRIHMTREIENWSWKPGFCFSPKEHPKDMTLRASCQAESIGQQLSSLALSASRSLLLSVDLACQEAPNSFSLPIVLLHLTAVVSSTPHCSARTGDSGRLLWWCLCCFCPLW